MLVPVCLAIAVSYLNPVLTKSSTLLRVLLFPTKKINPVRGLRKGKQSLWNYMG